MVVFSEREDHTDKEVSLSTNSQSTKQQPHDYRTERIADEPLYHHIDKPTTRTQYHPQRASEKASARSYEDELEKLSCALSGFETKCQIARDSGTQEDRDWMGSEMEDVLEKAISYIEHLQEQEKVLEQESEALRNMLNFWTGPLHSKGCAG